MVVYFQRDMMIVDALGLTILSIGDGLVGQFIDYRFNAAGILVTRSSEEADLGEFVGRQLTIYPRAIGISGVPFASFAFFFQKLFGRFSFLQ